MPESNCTLHVEALILVDSVVSRIGVDVNQTQRHGRPRAPARARSPDSVSRVSSAVTCVFFVLVLVVVSNALVGAAFFSEVCSYN